MESKNDVFLKESPIPGCHFQVPYQTLGGVEARYTKIKIYTKRRQIMVNCLKVRFLIVCDEPATDPPKKVIMLGQ